MSVTSKFYPGEVGDARPAGDDWLVVTWPSEPGCRCWMKRWAVTVIN
jgi:hypothetical protein